MNLGGAIHINKPGLLLVFIVVALFLFYFFSKSADTSSAIKDEFKDSIDLSNLLIVAIKAAQNGGNEVLKTKDNLKIDSKGKTGEGINDPVTTADYNSHCAMEATLKHQYPDISIVSEENKVMCNNSIVYDYSKPNNVKIDVMDSIKPNVIKLEDITIWIDPLDATKEFTEKLYQYVTTMVCVAVKGEPIIGVIHKPFENKTYYAWVGKEERNLKVGSSDGTQTKIVVSISHRGTIEEVLKKNFKDVKVITAAGAGYKVLEVVAGNADAYVHNTVIKKWDICAGNAILNAIGGRMTTKNNAVISYFNDGHPVNTDGLIATVKEHDKYVGKI
ncbi:putative inositol monophosphatase 3 [Atheta coriaria]|uniref:putative inositol monophosphatase 3 n=1 Tax=Dalotia coriaria TaxID=877792 RepID=UPI0031F3780D